MEVGTCCNLSEQCFFDLNYLWSNIRLSYFHFFPKVAFTEFDPEKFQNESEKKSWMLQTLAKEGWAPLPVADDDMEKLSKDPELQNMLFILKNEADPDSKFPKMFAMLPFTKFPEGQPRYSLPTENNIPGVVRYICIDFDKVSDIQEFKEMVEDATVDGWDIYKHNLATLPDNDEMAKYHNWKAESSKGSIDSEKRKLSESESVDPVTNIPRRHRSSGSPSSPSVD